MLAALVCRGVSLTAFGLSRRRLLRADGDQARLGTVMAITYAGNALSMAVPFAGAQLAAVFSYQQFRRRGLGPAITSWALAVSAIVVLGRAGAGAARRGVRSAGSPLATLAGLVGAAVFLLPGVTVLLALRYRPARAWIHRVLACAAPLAAPAAAASGDGPGRAGGVPGPGGQHQAAGPRYAEVFGLALVNWLGDCACLACAILATGAAGALARPAAGLRRRAPRSAAPG